MTILSIVTFPDSRLQKPSMSVNPQSDHLQIMAQDMLETMYFNEGIGLAAPQVGENIRMIVLDVSETRSEPRTLLNPVILEASGSAHHVEGCLSAPGVTAKVTRPAVIQCQAYDLRKGEVEFKADGLLATCIQHEIDHLDGILFFDRLSRIKRNYILSKYNKLMNKSSSKK